MTSPFPVPEKPPQPIGSVSSEDRTFALVAHLIGLTSISFLGPLVILLIKKDSSPFVADQAKEALNFQLTILIALFVTGLSALVLIGFVLVPLVVLADIIYSIIAAMEANKGVAYRYPYTFRFIS